MRKMWFLLFPILFFNFLFTESVQAKGNKVLLVDESNNAIPYLCFKLLGTNQHILSDTNGFIILHEGQFRLSDTLQVESLFFENLKMQVKDLLKRDSITLRNRSFAVEGYYTDLFVADDYVLRGYKKDGKNNYGIQIYKDYDLIGDVPLNSSFRFIGKNGGFYYLLLGVDLDNECFEIARFKLP